jgi:hypothetical protein
MNADAPAMSVALFCASSRNHWLLIRMMGSETNFAGRYRDHSFGIAEFVSDPIARPADRHGGRGCPRE